MTPEDLRRAIDRPEDALNDNELTLRLSRQLWELRTFTRSAFFHLARLREDPGMADVLKDEAMREDLEQAYATVKDLDWEIEQADTAATHLSWRLGDARKGRPDPSTLTVEERKATRLAALQRFSAEVRDEAAS